MPKKHGGSQPACRHHQLHKQLVVLSDHIIDKKEDLMEQYRDFHSLAGLPQQDYIKGQLENEWDLSPFKCKICPHVCKQKCTNYSETQENKAQREMDQMQRL